jgi:hypothetical protein
MNTAAGLPSHCAMRIARSMSAKRAVRRLVNRPGVQSSSSASSVHVRLRSTRSSLSAACVCFKFQRSRLSLLAAGNLTLPTSTTSPVRKSSGARRSQRSMNNAYWHEVAPLVGSLWIAPPHNGWSASCALSSDDCCHSSSASSYQSSPRSRRLQSSAVKSATQSKEDRARTRSSLTKRGWRGPSRPALDLGTCGSP